MPSYTIRYPHPVSRVTWHPVDEGVRINIFAAAEEMSPPKSPDLKAVDGDLVDMELAECPRTPSAISLVVHHSALDLYGKSSPVSRTAEMILPECSPPSPCENTSTNSITILTPSHTGTTVFESRRVQPRRVQSAVEEGDSRQTCGGLRMDRLETLQDVLAEERKHRPTFEERLKTPIVSIPRNVLTHTAIASFDLAFPGFQAETICPQSDRKFDVSWELE